MSVPDRKDYKSVIVRVESNRSTSERPGKHAVRDWLTAGRQPLRHEFTLKYNPGASRITQI